MQVNQPVQYDPTKGINTVPQGTPNGNNSAAVNTQQTSGYPYGEDVFTGQYEMFKSVYATFDTGVSRFSPFYGKMGNSNPNQPLENLPSQVTQPQVQPQNPVVNQQQVQQAPAFPKKEPPKGPVINNMQQLLQQEAQTLQTPQKAVEAIAQHAMVSRQDRTIANDISWGARFYAKKAEEMSSSLSKNKRSLPPGEVQKQLRTIEDYRIKSISMLNEAKKKAINTYNEALKATLLYNHFFTESGPFTSQLNPNDRQFVESEIDKTWQRWTTGFEKDWQGQKVLAESAPTIIDKSAGEVAASLENVEKSLALIMQGA